MMANRFITPIFQALNTVGTASPGYKLYFYQTGTTTPKDTYSDAALTTPNTNPVIADGNGYFGDIFLATDTDYNVVYTDDADATIWQADPVSPATTITATSILATDGTSLNPSYSFVNDTDMGMFRVGTNKLGHSTAGVTAMTIDENQRILIGTEDAYGTTAGVSPNLQVNGDTGDESAIGLIRFGNDSTPAVVQGFRTRATILGNNAAVQDGDILFRIRATGDDGVNPYDSRASTAEISFAVDETNFTVASGVVPTELRLGVATDGTSMTSQAFRMGPAPASGIYQILGRAASTPSANGGVNYQRMFIIDGTTSALIIRDTSGGDYEFASASGNLTIRDAAQVSTARLRYEGPSNRWGAMDDNTDSWGYSGARWSVVYAATGTINTSDENEKTEIDVIDDALLDAFGAIQPRVFKWIDAVEKKGADARLHFGFIAQELKAALEDAGYDAAKYGAWCYDEWEAEESEDFSREAGNRQGIRYAELWALKDAYDRRERDRLQAEIDAIKTHLGL